MSSPEEEHAVGDPQLQTGNFHSKLPVLDKSKTEDGSLRPPLDILSKMIGLDTLFSVLSEEHLGLQLLMKDTMKKLRAEEKSRKEAEGRLTNHNPINVALAERIQALEESEARLRRENKDLREENDLLEFRVLEMEDSIPPKRTPTRTPDPGRFPDLRSEFPEMDDVSDSGVMSLPTSDDEHHEFNLDGVRTDEECSKQLRLYGPYQEARCDRDVKSRLLGMCQSAGTVSERICLQQALALLRHYEARIEGLESTIAAMCHEATMSRSLAQKAENTEPDITKSSGKIVATVLPFSEAGTSSSGKSDTSENRKDLTESGIFEDNLVSSRGTQTDSKKWQTADLTAELEKLSRIRERIETGGKPIQTPKDLTYYEKRIEALQGRLAVYESSDDEQTKALRSVLSRSTQLTAQVTHLQEKISRLEKDNIRLEEERSELEELENDARLRCQRLESKLSTLGEKKRSLKNKLEDLRREMNDRDINVQDDKIEALVDLYEKKNLELEEREMEVRYRLQMLENTMPALMMWNIWKMMMTIQGGTGPLAVGSPSAVPIAASETGPKEVDEFSEFNNIDAVNTKEEELVMKLKQLETKLNTQNKILADSKATEDSLRIKLQQLENWMTGGNAPPMVAKDLDSDVEMFDKLSKMAKDRMDMDKRIKDLELKEKVFKETLEQADNMIAQLESQFRTQLNDKDQELNETSARLRDSETKLKVAEKNSSQTLAMQDRVTLLESAVDKLKKTLQARDREKERLEEEYGKLLKDVEQSGEDLEAVKNELDAAKKRLESSRKVSKQLEDELRSAEVEREAAYGAQKAEVNSLKFQISQLQRDLMENEVTISELKEEVLTLESAVDELRYTARLEKAEKEELTKNFDAQMEMKEKELEEAKLNFGGGDENVRSILEELEEGEKNAKGGHKFPWTLANGNGEQMKTVHCFRTEVDRTVNAVLPPSEPIKETKVKRPTVSPPPPPVSKIDLSISMNHPQKWHSTPVATDNLTRWNGTSVSEPPARWNGTDNGTALAHYELKNMTAAQFRAFIALIEEGEPHVDVMSTKGIPLTPAYSNNNLPMECQEAHNAVIEISGKEAKLTVEALSKAYNHSKICGDCNERLGNFVEEMVKKLGVRMPRIKDAEDICEYGGAPSNLKTKEVGPGSVGWDPKSSPGGYKVKPTMTGLLMAAEELKDKCRVKDAMIEALADELRDLERRGRWNAHRVLRELTLHPNPSPIDFNRQTLSRYLNNDPIDDFDDRDEKGREYFATNPLGLTIVRRVGPDSLLLKWLPIADPKITSYEIYANGLLMQRIMSPGRSKALLHPMDLDKKMIITLNALSYDGEKEESASVIYKK